MTKEELRVIIDAIIIHELLIKDDIRGYSGRAEWLEEHERSMLKDLEERLAAIREIRVKLAIEARKP